LSIFLQNLLRVGGGSQKWTILALHNIPTISNSTNFLLLMVLVVVHLLRYAEQRLFWPPPTPPPLVTTKNFFSLACSKSQTPLKCERNRWTIPYVSCVITYYVTLLGGWGSEILWQFKQKKFFFAENWLQRGGVGSK